MFGMERRDVTRKLHGLPATGLPRNGSQTWFVREAATRLARLPDDVIARVCKMNHHDLPPTFKKEYWAGESLRLKVEKETGRLWDTSDVIEYAGGAFKDIRMALLLLLDGVERETTVTDAQRAVMQRLIDSALEDARQKLVDSFEAKRPPPEENEIEDDGTAGL